MAIIELEEKGGTLEDVKFSRLYAQFQELLTELRKKELTQKVIDLVNQDIEELNSTSLVGKELRKLFKKKQTKILNLLEKELKIVPKDYHKSTWMALGTAIFGFPIGTTIGGIVFDNQLLFAIGMPFGLVIGMVLGSEMDKKAFKEGRQLNVEIKY